MTVPKEGVVRVKRESGGQVSHLNLSALLV